MKKKPALRTYEITTQCGDAGPTTLKIEGAFLSGYALGDGAGSSCLALYGDDEKTPILMVAWDAFVMARLISEVEVLKVKRSKKVIELEARRHDEQDEEEGDSE
ncbi:MAG: hypothetical protein ACO3FL_04455 [Ilumatobacteraceae bacterium]